MADDTPVGVRLSKKLLARLEKIKKQQRRSRHAILQIAIEDYVERWELDHGKEKAS